MCFLLNMVRKIKSSVEGENLRCSINRYVVFRFIYALLFSILFIYENNLSIILYFIHALLLFMWCLYLCK